MKTLNLILHIPFILNKWNKWVKIILLKEASNIPLKWK